MTLFILQKRYFIALTIAATLAMMPVAAGAQAPNTSAGGGGFPNTSAGGTYPSTSAGTGQPSTCGSGPCAVNNPLTVTSVCGLLKNIFNAVVAIGIPVAVLFIIWSGFKFVLAQGNSTKLQDARRNFFYVVIGIAIFLGAWILAQAIAATVNAIGGSTLISCQ